MLGRAWHKEPDNVFGLEDHSVHQHSKGSFSRILYKSSAMLWKKRPITEPYIKESEKTLSSLHMYSIYTLYTCTQYDGLALKLDLVAVKLGFVAVHLSKVGPCGSKVGLCGSKFGTHGSKVGPCISG